MKPGSIDAQVLRSLDDLEHIGSEWDALAAVHENPLLSHRWFAAAAEAFHTDGSLHVIALRASNRLIAVAPMAWMRRNGVPTLEIIGARALNEPTGLPVEDRAAASLLAKMMLDQQRPIVLQRVSAEQHLHAVFEQRTHGRGWLFNVRSAPSRIVELAIGDTPGTTARLVQPSASLRRKRKILAQLGPVSFETLRPRPEQLATLLEEALQIEAAGWKGQSRSAVLSNSALRQFLWSLSTRFAATNELRMTFLRAGNSRVAMALLLEFGRRLWEIKIGYSAHASRASPGRLLLFENLCDAHVRGLIGYEFLGSGDGQQLNFANANRQLQTVVFYPCRPASIWALAADAGAHFTHRLRH